MSALTDCHLHSSYSPDGSVSPEKIIQAAIAKGLKHIAITDHSDLRHPEGYIGVDKSVIDGYLDELTLLKEKYADKIYVAVGLEVGYMNSAKDVIAKLLSHRRPEYIINSVHCVNGTDCYAEGHFDGLDKQAAYGEYLDDVLSSLSAPYPYDTLGHLGYIERVAPYDDDRRMRFKEFEPQLAAIFDKLIKGDKILELNTSLSKATGISVPNDDLVKAYYDAGGRLITLSSDAHGTDRIADGFEKVGSMLKKIGFKYVTVKQNGGYVQFKL